MKKSPSFALSFLFAASLLAGATAFAAAGDDQAKNKTASTESSSAAPSAEWLAQAKAAYPLTTCVVSDDALGDDPEKPFNYVHKEAGKPDRLVRFCCEDCVADFKKEPAKYLKQLDDAAAKKNHGNANQK